MYRSMNCSIFPINTMLIELKCPLTEDEVTSCDTCMQLNALQTLNTLVYFNIDRHRKLPMHIVNS